MSTALRNLFAFVTSHGMGRALRHRYYVWMEAVGWTGLWFHRTAVGWLTWELTKSPTLVGMIVVAEAVPAVILAPFAGVFADRFDRLFIARITQTGLMLNATALAYLTIVDLINIEILFVIMVLNGGVSAFWQPARMSLVAGLVPREDLPPAIGLHSVMFNLARFAGPAMAGITISWWGAGPAFAFNAVSYAAFLVVFFYIKVLYPDQQTSRRASFFSNFKEGLVYAFGHASLGHLLLFIFMFSFFGRAWTELYPAISGVVFGLSGDPLAESIGFMLSGLGIGAVIGSFWMGSFARPENLVSFMTIGVLISIVGVAMFALTDALVIGVILSAAMGFGMNSIGTGGQMMVQTTVRGDMRGRVLGIWGMMIRTAPAFGALTLGWLSEFIGFSTLFIVTALICVGWGFLALRHRRDMTNGMLESAEEYGSKKQ